MSEIAREVNAAERSAVSVMEETFQRAGELNPLLNALIAVRRSDAMMDAIELDIRIRNGSNTGPLAGVPFSVKDVVATQGLPTTCGSRALLGMQAGFNAAAVERMETAGAILVGKSNCPEFAFSIATINDRYGKTRNPLGDFTVGGSSGGEAAALASGMSAAGLGTDFGGSIRWPAQCTGIVGLRPTIGRVPGSGQIPDFGRGRPSPPNSFTLQGRLQVIGPMARSVDDVETILRVIAGPDGLDPSAVPVPLAHSSDVRMGAVECRWGTQIGKIVVSDEIAAAVSRAAEILGQHCAGITEGLPTALNDAHELYTELRDGEPLSELSELVAGREHLLTRGIRDLLAHSQPTTELRRAELWAERDLLRHDLLSWLRGRRLLVLPVSIVAPYVSAVPKINKRQLSEADIVAPCRLISLFGLPAISVPCGLTADGFPVSVQIVGPPFREDLVLAAARLISIHGRVTTP